MRLWLCVFCVFVGLRFKTALKPSVLAILFCNFSFFLWFLCVCFCARPSAGFGFFLVVFLSVRPLAAGRQENQTHAETQ